MTGEETDDVPEDSSLLVWISWIKSEVGYFGLPAPKDPPPKLNHSHYTIITAPTPNPNISLKGPDYTT